MRKTTPLMYECDRLLILLNNKYKVIQGGSQNEFFREHKYSLN